MGPAEMTLDVQLLPWLRQTDAIASEILDMLLAMAKVVLQNFTITHDVDLSDYFSKHGSSANQLD